MATAFLSHVNFLAVIVSAIGYFLVGSVWFSAFFGKTWSGELEKHGVKIQAPAKGSMIGKLIQTFISNLITAFSVAFIIYVTGAVGYIAALKIGVLVSVGFAATVLGTAYTWEGKSVKLFLIDAGYASAGIFISAIVITLWQ